jgi:mannose-6-phosphate isomerase-like protein (cupin superfamily)
MPVFARSSEEKSMSHRMRALAWLPFAAAAVMAADTPAKVEYFKPAEVDEARASGDTGKAIITNAEFKVIAARRDKPGKSEVHVADTDIFIVIDGSATIVIGGKMTDPREESPGEIRGSGIEGGTPYLLERGVVLTVPRNTPHWVREAKPGFRYYVVKAVKQG